MACNEDNELRALERFSTDAITFCPTFTQTGGPLPTWLAGFSSQAMTSACACFVRTAAGGVPAIAPTTSNPAAPAITATGVPSPLVTACSEDNELRALERFNTDAITFCATYTRVGGPLPTYLAGFSSQAITSACSCFIRTATGSVPAIPPVTSNPAAPAITATGVPSPLVTACSEDNELRALERFNTDAITFCATYTRVGGPLPTYLAGFSSQAITSACSCFIRTATGSVPAIPPVTSNPAAPAITATGVPSPLVTACSEDNELRALERFNTDAITFCATYTRVGGPLPTYLAGFSSQAITSACSCFIRTATGGVPATTPTNAAGGGGGGGLLGGALGGAVGGVTSAAGAVISPILNPPPASSSLCNEDNELRALERFNTDAINFCPTFTRVGGALPTYLAGFTSQAISSACSCFIRTAAGNLAGTTPTPTAGAGGLLGGAVGGVTSAAGAVISPILNPPPASSSLCNEDNELRALERFNTDAINFCPTFTRVGGALPTYLAGFTSQAISSACSCFIRTAAGNLAGTTPTPTAGAGGLLGGALGGVTSALPVVSPIVNLPPVSSLLGSLTCYADNELRALQRFSTDAINFCPVYLVAGGPLPTYLAGFTSQAVSSACSCFAATAGILPTGIVPTNIVPTNIVPTIPPLTGLPLTLSIPPLSSIVDPLICYADNELRALERFSTDAVNFCPVYLVAGGPLPDYLAGFTPRAVSSACSCFRATATGSPTGPLPTPPRPTGTSTSGISTSTTFVTRTYTFTSCSSGVTNCPASAVTSTSASVSTITPSPTTPPICYEDNEFRALLRFSTEARPFCATYTVAGGPLPTYVSQFASSAISSACTCLAQTSTTTPGGTTTSGSGSMSMGTSIPSPTSPGPSPSPICYEDNEFRALLRFSTEARPFCATYTVAGGPLPTYVSQFASSAISSACTCLARTSTATSGASSTSSGGSGSSTGGSTTTIRTSTLYPTTKTFTTVSNGSTIVTQVPSLCVRKRRVRAVRV